MLSDSVFEYIDSGKSAVEACLSACDDIAQMFAAMDDEYLSARADDIRDIFNRIVANLSGGVVNPFEGVKQGDIIGLDNKKILTKGSTVEEVTLSLIEKLRNSDHEMITLYSGKDVTEEEGQRMLSLVAARYPDMEVDIHVGGQPLYYYFISLE
jgi:hypothetical protein